MCVFGHTPDDPPSGDGISTHVFESGLMVRESYDASYKELNLKVNTRAEEVKVFVYKDGVLVTTDVVWESESNLSYRLAQYGTGNYEVYVGEGRTVHYITQIVVK